MTEIKEDLNKWKDTPCSQTGRSNIAKMPILSKLTYRFDTVLIIISVNFFAEIDKLVLKFIWKFKEARRIIPS